MHDVSTHFVVRGFEGASTQYRSNSATAELYSQKQQQQNKVKTTRPDTAKQKQ